MADRHVRVFTVASESRYLVVRNVPALGVIDDLLKRLSLYGKVCEYRLLDHADDRRQALPFQDNVEDEQFTDTVWVKYETVNNARHAKNRGVQKPFFGSKLQIAYAPQFETREDTADKLAKRRELLLRRALPGYRKRPSSTHEIGTERPRSATVRQDPDFIGPQLPAAFPRPPAPTMRLHSLAQTTGVDKPPQQTKRRRI